MSKCKFYDGDCCVFEDYATGQTDEGDCKTKGKKPTRNKCGSFSEEKDEDED